MLNKANPTESLALEHIGMAELESPWLKSLTPTRNSHTWIAFGDGSWPMLALDQHPGTGWEIPHRRAQKGMPREDSAKNSVVPHVLALLIFLGQITGGSSTLGQ